MTTEFKEIEKVLRESPEILEFMMLVKDSPELIERAIAELSKGSEVQADEYEFIAKQCEKALLENNDYMNKERGGETDLDVLQAMAEELCYRQGFNDAMQMLLKGI